MKLLGLFEDILLNQKERKLNMKHLENIRYMTATLFIITFLIIILDIWTNISERDPIFINVIIPTLLTSCLLSIIVLALLPIFVKSKIRSSAFRSIHKVFF